MVQTALLAQIELPEYVLIKGKVLDEKSRTPLPYAHVGIPEQGIGTTTGSNGTFSLKIPRRYADSDLQVSYIGYSNFKQSLERITTPTTIYMKQTPNELVEVVVMEEAAIENIIRKAVKNIPKNYPTHPTTVLGFYRESRTDDSLNYVYLAEGVLNMYKTSYRSKKEGMISLVQGRKINLKNPLDTSFYSGFTSGHMAGHRFDFVKNRVEFIDERFFPAYKYWIEKITYYNDRPIYIIRFEENEDAGYLGTVADENQDGEDTFGKILGLLGGKSSKKRRKAIKARMRGRIFIDQESYAFLRAEFNFTQEGLRKRNNYPWYSGNWNGNSYIVNYRQLGEKWYFSDAIREGNYSGGGTYNNEIKVTQINTESSKPIPYLERLSRGSSFVRMTGTYDEDFWKSYNTTPLSEGLAESVRQLDIIKKAQEAFEIENMSRLQRQRDSIQRIETLKAQEELESSSSLEEKLDIEFGEPGIIRKKRKKYAKVQFGLGLGTHLIQTESSDLSIRYVEDQIDQAATILEGQAAIKRRNFEIITNFDLDFYFSKHLFLRLSTHLDFSNAIYKQRGIGLGTSFNLSRQRPVHLKFLAQYDNLRYARKHTRVSNEYGTFEVNGKKFNSKAVNLYYGSKAQSLRASVELSIERNRHARMYFRGTLLRPFDFRNDVWFWERSQIFKKKTRLPVNDSQVIVEQNGNSFNETILPDQSIMLTVGYFFF